MSYELFSKFCSTNGNLHPQNATYCSLCGSRAEIIDLSGSSPPRTNSALSNPASRQSYQPPLPPAVLAQRDTVNNQLKNIQNSRPNAGSNALSSRLPNGPRTTSQHYAFTIVLISESFYYTSQEDQDFGLPTVITRKHIGIFLLRCCTIYTYYLFLF